MVDPKDSGKTIEVSLSRMKELSHTQIDEVHTTGITLTVRVGSVECGLVERSLKGLELVTFSNV